MAAKMLQLSCNYLILHVYFSWKARVGGDTDEERLNNAFDAMYEYYLFVINGVSLIFMVYNYEVPFYYISIL